MNRRTFVLLSGAVSGSLRVPLRASARGAETPEAATGRLYFEFDNRHRWSLWYRGEGPAVPVLPFTSAGVHLGETTGRILTLEDLDDVSLQAGNPVKGESTIIRGHGAGLFVEATFLMEPPAPAPRVRITIRIYPDTSLPDVGGVAWAAFPIDRALPGTGDLLAQIDERTPSVVPLPSSNAGIRSQGSLALSRRTANGAVRAVGLIQDPAGVGAFSASTNGDQLSLDSLWTPARPVSTAGDSATVTICYHPHGDGVAALAAACAPAAGDRDFLATLDPPAGLWLSGSQGRGDDLVDLLGRAANLFDPRFARFVAYDLGDGTPRGHRWCTDQIHAAGLLTAGSLAPFESDDPAPDALREQARVATQEWGYDALILHGLDAVLPNIDRLRAGLAAIHAGAGSAILWSASVVPQTGTLDVVRVGVPPTPGWASVVEMASNAGLRSYYHRSWWLNDPGPMILGYPLTLEETRTQLSLAAVIGGAATFTADVLEIPDAQVDLVRRAVPVAPVAGRPVDSLSGSSVWVARTGDWSTVVASNWGDQKFDHTLRFADLGLGAVSHVGYDVWNDAPLPATDPLQVTLEPHEALVVALRPRADHPQVIGTTRHVVQGCVDLQDEHWDGKAQTLSGRAVKLDGRPYRVTIAGKGWTPDALTGDKPGTVRALDSEYLVLEWPGGERGDFGWQLTFKRAAQRPHPRPVRRGRPGTR